MKKRTLSLFMTLIMLLAFVPAFAAASSLPTLEAPAAGQLSLSNIGMDTAYRLVLPDGTRTGWNVRGEYDDDSTLIQPLDGGEYYLEVCPLSALTVLVPDSDYPPEKYDLRTEVPSGEIQASEKVTVEQPADEGDNVVDLAEGEAVLSPSYNDYTVFTKENDVNDSDFDYSSVTDGPAVKYVSTDDGATWKKLTGDVTITSSSAEPVPNGVRYEMSCGDNSTAITLDNVKTTGYIYAATFGETVFKIKGDVTVKGIDTDQLGTVKIVGADSSAKLTVNGAILGANLEIKDLAELKIVGRGIAVNCIMGDLKLTNIPKLDISATRDYYATGIRSYDSSIILTNVFGTIDLPNDPEGNAIETGTGKKLIINTDGAYVYSGTDSAHLEEVTLLSDGTFPEDKLAPSLLISDTAVSVETDAAVSYSECLKDEACPIQDFTDAAAGAWYHDGVHYCIDNGIMGGYGNGIFGINDDVTRQQVWLTLARISGETPADAAEAREWAMENEVSDGTNPADAVTRQQFITMLYRYAVSKGYDVSVGEDTNILSYDDALEISEWAREAMQWGCGSGVMGGYDDGTLKPAATTARAHLATFLQRFCENVVK